MLYDGKIQCTYPEMCAILDCDENTLRHRFSGIIKKGQQEGRMSLRRNQFRTSEKSVPMQIWLGKQYLGQKDAQLDDQKTKEFVTNIISYAGSRPKENIYKGKKG